MIYDRVRINGESIALAVDEEEPIIRVWVNDRYQASLPLVYDGRLTIRLTPAAIDALKSQELFRWWDIEKVTFMEDDGNRDN